jgi:hypothetical protein
MQNTEIGQLEELELKQVASLRQAANEMINQIGQLEVQKARILGQMSDIEERAQGVLNAAKQRFGVQDKPCFITGDGKIMLATPPDAGQPG